MSGSKKLSAFAEEFFPERKQPSADTEKRFLPWFTPERDAFLISQGNLGRSIESDIGSVAWMSEAWLKGFNAWADQMLMKQEQQKQQQQHQQQQQQQQQLEKQQQQQQQQQQTVVPLTLPPILEVVKKVAVSSNSKTEENASPILSKLLKKQQDQKLESIERSFGNVFWLKFDDVCTGL